MTYAPVAVAVIAAALLAWVADLMTGRRGLFATSLVSGVGAACGWFISQRVFGMGVVEDWDWVIWSVAAAALSLAAFFLFRNKR